MASSLTSPPAEIRSMIYQHLVPHIYLPVKPPRFEIYRSMQPADEHPRWKYYKPSHSTTLHSELPVVVNLMLASRFLCHEVIQILHGSSILSILGIDNFTKYTTILMPYARLLIHRVMVRIAKSSTKERHQLIEGSKRMTGLQEFILTHCDISTDTRYGGVKWKAYVFQKSKLSRKRASLSSTHTIELQTTASV